MSLSVIVGPPLGSSVIFDSRDVTKRLSSLTFSNSDPGGFEICTMGLTSLYAGLRPNGRVTVRIGMEVAWDGRINAIGESDSGAHSSYTIDCVGYGAVLSDDTTSMIFVDRDLSRWGDCSAQRKINLISSGVGSIQGNAVPAPDTQSGFPALDAYLTGPWAVSATSETLYDAGPGNLIGSIYYSVKYTSNIVTSDANWKSGMITTADDTAAVTTTEIFQSPIAGPMSGTLTSATARRYAQIYHYYNAAGGANGATYHAYWQVAVYGNHGITKRGSAPQGLYPADVAQWAMSNFSSTSSWSQVIGTDPFTYIQPHLVYYTPVPWQQIVDDAAKVIAFHWGVWEPRTTTDTNPTFYFTQRPSSATILLRRGAVSELDAPKVQLDQLYTQARVHYTDAAGVGGYVTVTMANPYAAEAGIASRTLNVDMGLGTSTTANTYGQMILALAQAAARGSGSGITPLSVQTALGFYKPSALIRAGRDRVRILDLPDSGPYDVTDSRRFDTFNVRRVESTLGSDGQLQTRIEFDGGADLVEVLNARLATASVLAGV